MYRLTAPKAKVVMLWTCGCNAARHEPSVDVAWCDAQGCDRRGNVGTRSGNSNSDTATSATLSENRYDLVFQLV